MSLSSCVHKFGCQVRARLLPAALVIQTLLAVNAFALPKRLVLALDGVSYRDMKALQEGVSYTNLHGRQFQRRAFNEGWFPVSRNIGTFPSTSDVAWTDIFGNRPLPGYQRTYFSEAENRQISINSVTTSTEHERQMHWQVESGFRRAMAYIHPGNAFNYEVRGLAESFLSSQDAGDNFYAYLRATDDAQHMSGDIFAMLAMLDEKLKDLRARYRAREGRELEIVIISDHGHNRAGAGKRVEVRSFLQDAGYRVTKSITDARDVVLPTCGIESWVEIHNAPAETEKLAQLLQHLEGVDLVTARLPDQTNRFLVMNAKGARAVIDWNAAKDSFRYSTSAGDPLDYGPAVAALAQKHLLDAEGFASADNWMAATESHRYPLALERIVVGLTRITLNPATILVSLSNGYVNDGWLVDKTSRLMTLGGTHGGLDDFSSDGIVLSSFKPTQDSSTSRVAAQFDGFPGLRDYRAGENGAEWVTSEEQAMTRIARGPFDTGCRALPADAMFLRIWTPGFARLELKAPVEILIEQVPHLNTPRIRRTDPPPVVAADQPATLNLPVSVSEQGVYERVYALPSGLILEPGTAYRISGRIREQGKSARIFKFDFRTDGQGVPVAY